MARRRPAEELPPDGGDGAVPLRLCRFRMREWLPAADQFEAHRQYRQAREEWAVGHGFDVRAKYGEKPDRDWPAFLKLCRSQSVARDAVDF